MLVDTIEARCRAAFLGLALGDAYGQPLEFVGGSSVRTVPVRIELGVFRWTDDTHMALYLADALLDCYAGPYMSGDPITPDVVGHAIGDQFVVWLRDPLMPSTAPGGTCLSGARKYASTRDWRSSGVVTSDGCGAVMRIAPIPMACRGQTMVEIARISAIVTHGHQNAQDAAIAACVMLRSVLDTGAFIEATVKEAIAVLRGRLHGVAVIAALEAAIALAKSDEPWLDEAAIPDGDGGWRSPSALGLAVAAALKVNRGWTFKRIVDQAARINGDSDSVACLAGMFAGAVLGVGAMPSEWLEALPFRERIRFMAELLSEIELTLDIEVDHG